MNARRTACGLLGIWLVLGASLAFALTVDDVSHELICTCGCNMVVSSCECSAAAKIKKEIAAKLNSGQPKDAILASFVNEYGEKVLAAPTKHGFNLTAWILPFVVVIGGIGVVFVLLKKWAAARGAEPPRVSSEPEDEAYWEKIEKELKTFET